jgi:tetratricopeptide (TPR) repeat protein
MKKQISDKAENCSQCGVPVKKQKGNKQKKWHERTSVTLCVAAVIIIIGFGFIHIITGVVSPFHLPFDITYKESFGYRETFINAGKITSMPYVAAKLKYPISCKILQKLEYFESSNVFETKMHELLRRTMKKWQAEFEETLNKPQQQWQDQLRGNIESIEKTTITAEAYNNRGINAANEGQYETAISEFTRAFKKNPAYADAYYNRGLVYITIGQLGPAISDFTQTIEINPELIDAYAKRGNIHVTMNQYDQAISDFTKVLEIDPNCTEVYFKRAIVCFAKGQCDRAWEDVNKIQNMGLSVPSGFLMNLRRASKTKR